MPVFTTMRTFLFLCYSKSSVCSKGTASLICEPGGSALRVE